MVFQHSNRVPCVSVSNSACRDVDTLGGGTVVAGDDLVVAGMLPKVRRFLRAALTDYSGTVPRLLGRTYSHRRVQHEHVGEVGILYHTHKRRNGLSSHVVHALPGVIVVPAALWTRDNPPPLTPSPTPRVCLPDRPSHLCRITGIRRRRRPAWRTHRTTTRTLPRPTRLPR